jgi:hypothetical protein
MYAPHIQRASKKGTKRPQEVISLRLLFLGTKIPQGIILPAAWICIVKKLLSNPFQSGRMQVIQI